jgi:hypothetical protein
MERKSGRIYKILMLCAIILAGCSQPYLHKLHEEDGTEVLVITTGEGDAVYETLIFEDDGKLKEATIEIGDDYNLEFGDVLASVSDFCVNYDNSTGLVKITIETQGERSSVNVYAGVR